MRSIVAIAILFSSLFWTRGQSTLTNTYDAKARALLIQEATRISTILSDSGVLPKESFTNATVTYRGRAAQPTAEVRGNICAYEFRRGALSWIDRKDLFVDKGPESLILLHLTSDQLTLTTNQAAVRALEIIERLGLDMPSIRKNYTISVKDDLMIAFPIRNGGPNFPRDLHFFGELRSRHKIKISVNLTPVLSDESPRADFRLEFLATTGEFLGANFPDPESFAYYGVPTKERITITNASDFTPPVYVTVITNSPNMQNIPEAEAVELLNAAARQLQKQIGVNNVNAYLLVDNLNSANALARQMHQFARAIPWAGLSQLWMEDVPFDRSRLENLTRNQRGLAVMAICGDIAVQIEAMTNIQAMPFQGNDEESRTTYLRQRDEMQPMVAKFMDRFQISPAPPDQLILFAAPTPHRAFQTIEYLAGKTARERGGFVTEVPGNGAEDTGLEYFNGQVLTNAILAVSLKGNFPLEHDIHSLLQRQPEKRIPAASVSKPIQDFVLRMGRHPLHGMIHVIGSENIRALQAAQNVEVLRLNPNRLARPDASVAHINGYEILQTKTLGADAARQFAAVALNFSHTNHYSSEDPALMLISRDEWKPIVAFRVPNAPITFVSPLGLSATQILRPDSPPASFHFSLGLTNIALQAFPSDTELQERAGPP